MQVRDVGAAATGGLVAASALTVPSLVRRVRGLVEKMRSEERSRTEAIANLIDDVGELAQQNEQQQKSLDVFHEDLDIIIGVVAGAVLDLDSPPNKPLADLVASRPGPQATIEKIKDSYEAERQRRVAEREAKLAAEEAEAGTTLRCKDCDAVRPDYAEWMQGESGTDAPACPNCASEEEPEPRDA